MKIQNLLRLLGPCAFFALFLLLFIQKMAGQTVVASAGGFAQSTAGSVAFTLGEVRSGTASSGSTIITQGFQQPEKAGIISTDEPELFESLVLFPNPTEAEISLSFFSKTAFSASWEIVDEVGRTVFLSEKKAVAAGDFLEKIDLAGLSAGPYFFVLKTEKGGRRAAPFLKI